MNFEAKLMAAKSVVGNDQKLQLKLLNNELDSLSLFAYQK